MKTIRNILCFLLLFIFSFITTVGQVKNATNKNSKNPPLTKEELEAFKTTALQKTKDLGNYISTITDKQGVPDEIKDNAIELAIALFMSEENIVEVSSKYTKDNVQYPIRAYLNKIRFLNYSRIDIEWYDIHYISNLRQAPDGSYHGVITIFQKFTGFSGDMPKYSDITQKNIEVEVRRIETIRGKRWDALLGNISVEETE